MQPTARTKAAPSARAAVQCAMTEHDATTRAHRSRNMEFLLGRKCAAGSDLLQPNVFV